MDLRWGKNDLRVVGLPEIAIEPQNWWLEDEFPLGWPSFRGYVERYGKHDIFCLTVNF